MSMFDKFFDDLNVSNYYSGVKQKKTFLQPYRSGDDFRLKVSSSFVLTMLMCLLFVLVYLDTWEQSIII